MAKFSLFIPVAGLTCLGCLGAAYAQVGSTAIPSGAKVTAGKAHIESQQSKVSVTQESHKAIVEWSSFNIGNAASVEFKQPSSQSLIFNRVLDLNPSQIMGRIQANGQVILSNPNGIVFGPSSQVDVAGLIVTVHKLSDDDFLNDRLSFTGAEKGKRVQNQGGLRASLKGYIAMLAPEVRNEGVVLADMGVVAMASGEKIRLSMQGSQLLSVLVEKPIVDALISNKHLVQADGGQVILSARSANAVLESVISQSGKIQAASLQTTQGRVYLDGGERGVVKSQGTIDTNASHNQGKGGRIVITGDKVLVDEASRLTATGPTGGGEILVGGGWQGLDPAVRSANAAIVKKGARVDASATQAGDGGTVVIWSDVKSPDGVTRVAGELLARGGSESGDGGRIETSGAHLDIAGVTGDASAPKGKAGQWLLDPYNIEITAATNNNSQSNGAWTASGTSSTIAASDITSLLNSGSNVTVTTAGVGQEDGDITINAGITSSRDLASLTFTADRNIAVNQAINLSGSGSVLVLNAAGNTGTPAIGLNASITAGTLRLNSTRTGAVTQTAGAISATNLSISAPSGSVSLERTANVIGTLAAQVNSMVLRSSGGTYLQSGYSPGLNIGSSYGVTGVTATTTLDISNEDSPIFISNNVSAGGDLVLNAGRARGPASVAATGEPNLVLLNSATLTTSSRGILYTGTVAGGSEALASYIGSGSGRFRYASDESIPGYSTGLKPLGATGLYLLYRERPMLTVSVGSGGGTRAYGPDTTLTPSFTLFKNGDTQAIDGTMAAIAITGESRSSVGYLRVDSYNLDVSTGVSGLGYGFNYVNGNLTITPKLLTVTASQQDRDYSGNKNASAQLTTNHYSVGGLEDDVSATATLSEFSDKNAGANKTVSVTGIAISGADAGNYALSSTETSTMATINKKSVTLNTINASNKVYDGNTTAAVSSSDFSGLVGSETLSVTGAGTFDNKNAGDNKSVTVSNVANLTKSDGTGTWSNYNLTTTGSMPAHANITPKPITISGITVNTKTYDGNTSGTANVSALTSNFLTNTVGIVAGDSFGVGSVTATFADKYAGTGKAVALSNFSYTGSDELNYAITAQSSATGNIDRRTLNVSGIAVSGKEYDGSRTATVDVANAIYPERVTGDSVLVTSSGLFPSKNVGTNLVVTLTNSLTGTDANNYTLVAPTTALASITPRPISVSASPQDKVYDGSTSVIYQLNTNKLGGDVVAANASSANFQSKHADTNPKRVDFGGITLSGTDAGNYTLVNNSTQAFARITPKPITITGIAANDKVYDGGVAATPNLSALTPSYLVNTVGVIADDEFRVDSVTGTFDNKNAGTGKTVTLSNAAYSGSDFSNYTVTDQASTTGNINKKDVTLDTITASSKVYDGNTTAAVSSSDFSGLVGSETLSVSGTGTFNNKNAGTGKTVTVTNVENLTRADGTGTWSNYNLATTGPMTTTANISQVDVTLTSIAADNKPYDGNVNATISGGVVAGTVNGETLSVNGTGTFNNKNAGIGKTVTVTNVENLTRTDGTGSWVNYNLTTTGPRTALADITPKPITITGITVDPKPYDGNRTATPNLSALNAGYLTGTVGVVANDDFEVTTVTGTFDNKNAGAGKTVTLTNPIYTGADVNNYTITNQASATGEITRKPITISGITAGDKVYDGNRTATPNLSALNAAYLTGTVGVVAGDEFAVGSVTGTFDNKNVGTGKTVTLTNPNYTGADVNNYTITNQTSTTANITPKPITITGIAANDKVYDGNTSATIDARALNPNSTSNSLGIASSENKSNLESILNFLSDAFSNDTKVTSRTNRGYLHDVVGVVPGDDVKASVTGAFADKNVGTRKTVNLSTTYTGNDVSNYTITDQTTAVASITPRDGLRSLNTDLYYDPTLNSEITGKPPRIVTKTELPNYTFSGSINKEREQPNSTPMRQPLNETLQIETQRTVREPQWVVERIALLTSQEVSTIPTQWFSQLSTADITRIPEAAIQKLTTDQLLVLLPKLSTRQLQQLLPQQRRAVLRLSQN